MDVQDAPREATFGDNLSLGLAFASFAMIGTALWSAIAIEIGSEPLDGLDHGGVIGFLIAFTLIYVERASRWQRLSARTRATCHRVLVATIAASLLPTLPTLILGIQERHLQSSFLPVTFGIYAALCQIGTIIWLSRLRSRTMTPP